MLKIILISLLVIGISEGSKIDSDLAKKSGNSDVLISFDSIPKVIYGKSKENDDVSRTTHISNMVSLLKAHSNLSHKSVLNYLESLKSVQFQQLWITNQIVVKQCSPQLLKTLSQFPEVTGISEDVHYPLEDTVVVQQEPATATTPEWGLQMVKSPQANALLQDTLAQGDGIPADIRVVVIDTGIFSAHEALRDNFLGEYGWYDPVNGAQQPEDTNGHGTHVSGTISGMGGIGVFPSAKLLSCRGCGTSCPSSALIACGQYTLCPHLPDGTNENCALAPHVVSNSWNGGQGQTWFHPVIEAWHSANIIPVFSAGNQGPACGTLQSPADGNVISVGATTIYESMAYFSGVGPSIWGEILPTLSAPGYEVRSAWISSATSYAVASGTSMSCPHVSGLVALLMAYKPDLTFTEVKEILTITADTGLLDNGRSCGGRNTSIFPNNDYGHGRINALTSLERLIETHPLPTEPPTTEPPPPTTTTEEEPTTTQEPWEPTTEEEEPEEPSTTTTTTTTPPPNPGHDCVHGPIWFPDEVNLPNLVCVCQAAACCSGHSYNCITAANP